MDEIDYLISLLNKKHNVKGVQKLSQVDYFLAEEEGNEVVTSPNNLVLPVLGTTMRSKTDSKKSELRISKVNWLKPIKKSEKK